MPHPDLQPGDRVIELAGLAQSTAVFTGMVGAAVLAWLVKHSLLFCVGLLVAGAIGGWLIGKVMGQCLFPATAGNVVIVKVGNASIPSTLKAALSSALLVSGVLALGFVSLSAGQKPLIIGVSLGIGAVIGIGSGLLSALL